MLIKTVLLRFFRGVDREGAALLEKSTSLVSSLVNGELGHLLIGGPGESSLNLDE